MRTDKLSQGDLMAKRSEGLRSLLSRRPAKKKEEKLLLTNEDETAIRDGKIKVEYGTQKKQGGGEITDYNDITYVLAE